MWRAIRLTIGFAYVLLFTVGIWLPPQSAIHVLFGYLPPPALAAPLVLFAIWLLAKVRKRRFSRWDGAAVAGLVFLIAWGCDFRLHPLMPTKHDLRVMTLNVEWHMADSMPELNQIVKDRNVDVVLLQEVRGEGDSVARALQKAMPGWSCEIAGETAILSRWPLTEVGKTPLPTFAEKTRFALSATVQSPHPFRALTVHWSAPEWRKGLAGLFFASHNQAFEMALTREELHKSNLPVIFGGDLNCPPRHAHIQQLSREYTNAFSAAGNGLGWTLPSKAPIIRIDHLFSSPELDPVRAEVGPSCGSDHQSLIVDYAWRKS